MKVHEYQASQLLTRYQIPVARGEAIFDAKRARDAFQKLANPNCMIKVQVLMGGRGKAGGVRRVVSADEAEQLAATFIGRPFSTYQSEGAPTMVKAVMVTEEVKIKEEYYVGIVVDRSNSAPVILFSKEGGIEIEEVAASRPQAIERIYFPPDQLPTQETILSRIDKQFSNQGISSQIAAVAAKLARLFVEKDASICEINPLVLTDQDRALALDAKIVFDDNALFRHEDVRALKDPEEEDERERKAKAFDVSYVSMNGNVGCLVNGAGLAMATMDMIKRAGGEPANFLDVGGGATTEQVREGFKIILQDPRVGAILVNIFGGIMKCDVIADGVIQALREIKRQAPLIVRLEGTRVEEGRQLLKESQLPIISCSTIEEAAKKAVEEAKRASKTSHVHSH